MMGERICRNIGEALMHQELRIECMGCADFVRVHNMPGDETEDDVRFNKWACIEGEWYCSECLEDFD